MVRVLVSSFLIALSAGANASVVAIDGRQNNKTVFLNVGDTLEIRLLAGSGPDYVWQAGPIDESILRETVAQSQDLIGGWDPSQSSLTAFNAIGPGTVNLRMNYRNPARGGLPPVQAFSVKVNVGAAGPPATVLTDANNGGTATLTAGITLEVRLTSNPSTGFAWALTSSGNGLLLQDAGRFTASSSGMAGAPGVQIFKFRVGTPQKGVLKLAYQRSFQRNSRAKTWQVNYVIQ